MIDMTLLPEPFRKGWVAICAYSTGAAMHVRNTLEIGDILRPISAPAVSVSCLPPDTEEAQIRAQRWFEDYEREWIRKNTLLVGRDVSVSDLYPQLWADWRWVDEDWL